MTNKQPREMIRRKELSKYIPLSSTQIDDKLDNDPDFPKPIKLTGTGRAVAWFADEIAAYQERMQAKARAA
jgi:predicted DNA-binding transcriptional regulator AlpA